MQKTVPEAAFRLKSSPENFDLWPFHFELLFTVTVGHRLSMHLTTRDLDTKPFEITSALHSYIAVSDITKTQVKGLDGTRYYDKVKGLKAVQSGSLHVDQETDHVYRGMLCLCLYQCPDADGYEPNPCNVMQVPFTDILGNYAPGKHTETRRCNKRQRCPDKYRKLAYLFICRKQHGGQLGLVTELCNENSSKYRGQYFVFHLPLTLPFSPKDA